MYINKLQIFHPVKTEREIKYVHPDIQYITEMYYVNNAQ